MLHACDQRFDVTENLENFYELNKAIAEDPCFLLNQPFPYRDVATFSSLTHSELVYSARD